MSSRDGEHMNVKLCITFVSLTALSLCACATTPPCPRTPSSLPGDVDASVAEMYAYVAAMRACGYDPAPALVLPSREEKTHLRRSPASHDRKLILGDRPGTVIGDQIFYQDGKSGMIIGNQVLGNRPGMIIGDQIFYQDGSMGIVR